MCLWRDFVGGCLFVLIFEGFLLNDFALVFSHPIVKDTLDRKAAYGPLLSVCTAAILVEGF